jgi:hypothetical protein
MTSYAQAVLAVRDVLKVYAPNPDLTGDSIELRQAVESVAAAAAAEGVPVDTVHDDLTVVAHDVFHQDTVAAVAVAVRLKHWARAR